MAAKMATMFDDVTDLQQHHIKYTSSRREDQRLFIEGKIVSKCCNISKTQGRGIPSTPPLVPQWGLTLLVHVRVNAFRLIDVLPQLTSKTRPQVFLVNSSIICDFNALLTSSVQYGNLVIRSTVQLASRDGLCVWFQPIRNGQIF